MEEHIRPHHNQISEIGEFFDAKLKAGGCLNQKMAPPEVALYSIKIFIYNFYVFTVCAHCVCDIVRRKKKTANTNEFCRPSVKFNEHNVQLLRLHDL